MNDERSESVTKLYKVEVTVYYHILGYSITIG